MIEYKHKLPAMNIEGRHNGTYNNWEVGIPAIMTTTSSDIGIFLRALQDIVQQNRRFLFVETRVIPCCHNWVRDHVHIMKAFKHWEYRLKDFLEYMISKQTDEGFYYEMIKQLDDTHWKMVNDDCRLILQEDNVALIRLELEADVEYLMVEGAMYYYQATGDLDWLREVLPSLERAIDYITSSKKRWSEKYGLAIRPMTIDTWDFINSPTAGSDRRIHDDEPMGAMHGDNSGLYQAMNQLARINDKLQNPKKAASWRERAETLRENMMKYLWNGAFFVHQFPIDCAPADDKEAVRLSLSNPYDINRGVTTSEQSRSIIDEYQARRKTTSAFAEWFSIDPPYERFSSHSAGKYVNGAISPFTAGELAKAALNNGREAYGWDIISRFITMQARDGAIYFLYSPDDSKPQDGGPSAWGAAALLSAVDEALAGIVDADCLYREINLSPRFVVTPYNELRYFTGYEISGVFVELRFIVTDEGLRYDLKSPAERVHAHILLPEGKAAARVLIGGEAAAFTPVRVAESNYVDFTIESGTFSVEIVFA